MKDVQEKSLQVPEAGKEPPVGVKYLALAEALRGQIIEGGWKPGARLPSFTQLQREHGVTPNTVNRAIALLAQQGVVICERGRGVFVAPALRRTLKGIIGWTAAQDTDDSDPYWKRLLDGVRAAARHENVHVMLFHQQPEKLQDLVDGVLMHRSDTAFLASLDPLLPVVSMMETWEPGMSVLADDAGGAALATRHLLALGHRRIATLMFHEIPAVQARLQGWRSAMVAAGHSPQPEWSWQVRFLRGSGDHTVIAKDNMALWLANGFLATGCTALLAENDRMAIGCIQALAEHGLRVPDHISVVGFDGTLLAETARPSLTTLEVPFEEIGKNATQLLLAQIRGDAPVRQPGQIVLPVHLRARSSTGPIANIS